MNNSPPIPFKAMAAATRIFICKPSRLNKTRKLRKNYLVTVLDERLDMKKHVHRLVALAGQCELSHGLQRH